MSTWVPNPAQEQAEAHVAGPLRIMAGAGSGKTTSLVRRILRLLTDRHCTPAEVLMLTFTNKAVADMRARVAERLPPGSDLPRVETYHAFALALVQEFAHLLGLPPEPVLLTEGPARLFARRHFDRLTIELQDLTRLKDAVANTLDFFGWHRHEGSFRQPRADLLARLAPGPNADICAELLAAHEAYRRLLNEHGAVDYDDLIARAVQLLEEHPEVRDTLHRRFRFVLVDEYQDTDFLQGRFIRLMTEGHANLTVVGDPDQTIYSFRGAALSNILDFHQAWPGVTQIDMVTNYRSTPAILEAANAVIRHNSRRKQAPLQPHRAHDDFPRPLLLQAPTFPAEAAWIAREIRTLHDQGVAWRDIAVLVRFNKHKLPLYGALLEAGVPVRVLGGLDLLADPAVARLAAFLRAVAQPERDAELSVALGLPRYGLTDADLAALGRLRQGRTETLLDVVLREATAGSPRLQAFLGEFWPIYRMQHEQGCQAAVRAAIGLHAGAMGPQSRLGADQLLPLAEAFFQHVDLLAGSGAPSATPLALFCDYLDDLSDVGDPPEGVEQSESEDAVRLMTVHAAKGLEFPVVFLPRLTERDFHPKEKKWESLFPLAWHHDPTVAADYGATVAEEERRLFYVGMTRAMDRLCLSWAPVDPQRKRPMEASQFVAEAAPYCDVLALPESAGADVGTGLDVGSLLGPLVSDQPAPPVAPPVAAAAAAPAVPAVFSFSHLSTYQLCPYRYYLQYVVRLPGRPAPAADAGSRVHAAIERLAGALQSGQDVKFDQFRTWAAREPLEADADDLAEPEADPADDFDAALRNFWESEYASSVPVAVEQEFYVTVGDAVVKGFIDRIHRRRDGALEVVDFKTYNRLMSELEVRQGLQLPIYIKACREALGLPVSVGALYFLKQGATVRVAYTEAELEDRLREAERLIGEARAGRFDPAPGAVCGYCPYGEICPVSLWR